MKCIFLIVASSLILYYNETISQKYESFKRLYRLVSTKYDNPVVIFGVSCKMLCVRFYNNCVEYLTNNVKKIGKNMYEVSYIIDGKTYKMVVSPQKGPSPVLHISDDTMNDVTSQVVSYMGPSYDWHGNKFTPDFFGHKSLSVQMSDGTYKTFTFNEHLHIE